MLSWRPTRWRRRHHRGGPASALRRRWPPSSFSPTAQATPRHPGGPGGLSPTRRPPPKRPCRPANCGRRGTLQPWPPSKGDGRARPSGLGDAKYGRQVHCQKPVANRAQRRKRSMQAAARHHPTCWATHTSREMRPPHAGRPAPLPSPPSHSGGTPPGAQTATQGGRKGPQHAGD